MKIQDLIEATIYRHQTEWEHNDDPVIAMKGRISRETKGMQNVYVYEITYGLELLGIDCPRRWKSSFATTDPARSMYLETGLDAPGLREIQIPKNTPVGTVKDDWNRLDFMSASHVTFETSRLVLRNRDDEDMQREWRQWQELVTKWSGQRVLNDHAYQMYRISMQQYDVLMMDKRVDASWVPDEVIQYGTLESAIKESTKELIDRGSIAVYPSIDQVPEGKNLEVWFEGDYQAVKIDLPN